MTSETKSIRLGAVGDLTLGDHPLCVGFGAFSRFRSEEALFPLQRVIGVLRRSELLFGNLECCHSTAGLNRWNYHSVQMRGERRLLEALPHAGFDVLNVANNHSMQHGDDAFAETTTLIESLGMYCCGLAADDSATRSRAVVVRRNGLAVGFLGYSLRPRQYFRHVPRYAEGQGDAMVRDIEEVCGEVDSVVVSVHWGDEFIEDPSPAEVRLAHRLIDAGASVVLGHHPHVLRAVERHGEGYVAYSLGNFVCDMAWDDSLRTSVIFECQLTAEGPRQVNLVPVRINEDFQPEILSEPDAESVLGKLDRLVQQIVLNDAGDDSSEAARYAVRADEALRDIRRKSQRFFVSRLKSYPPIMLGQQLATYVGNRLRERVST